jgi:hypothetical protein
LSTNDSVGSRWRLRDFPAVFLSYDEPWADRNWLDLKIRLPRVARVHGVKGLDACHKAAADAVPGDWVVTVDADTRISPALADAPVPSCFLTGNFRIDWLARNQVNGLWSGNGCVKLWPKALIAEMRTHEAAPEGTLSLDHDVGVIRRGQSAQVTMSERAATTDPAATAFHGFRAGLRETVFLRRMAEEAAARNGSQDWWSETGLARLIEIWCSVGRHAANGRWVLYGARLGLSIRDLWPDWDIRQINDHDAIQALWNGSIRPRFQRGNARRANEVSWNWPMLESDLAGLANGLAARGIPALAELDSQRSGAIAGSELMVSPISPSKSDALGYRMLTAARSRQEAMAAGAVLEQAATQDHPAAHLNLGILHSRSAPPDLERAAWHLAVAALLGNEAARKRLDPLAPNAHAAKVVAASDLPLISFEAAKASLKTQLSRLKDPLCILADKGVRMLPQAARHVPDPLITAEVPVLGYLSRCPVTGLPRPRGIRMAAPDRLAADPTGKPDLFYPVVLGELPRPVTAADALRGGASDPGQHIPLLLATLGSDGPFGAHWIIGSLLARLGQALSPVYTRRIAAATAGQLDAEIMDLTRALAERTEKLVPVWTPQESQALKRMISAVPPRRFWLAAADALCRLGPQARSRGHVLRSAAAGIWGDEPAAL